jgi:alpha-glucosidase
MDLTHWTSGLHHDGSAYYVSNPLPAMGESVTIRLRAPSDAPIRAVYMRTTLDGEGELKRMTAADRTDGVTLYEIALPITMPHTNYRFKIIADDAAYYLTSLGTLRFDPIDLYDFKLLANFRAPEWVLSTVFYQIFPDRFYNGDPSISPRPGEWSKREFTVQLREWGAPPLPYAEAGNLDFYGGDLIGVQQKIEYFKELGVNALYLTPIFRSNSNHRYNIDDFYNVDQHLGGNEALVHLTNALHDAGIRLMLDVTPNHTSSQHPWFTEAQKSADAPTSEYYTFDKRPDDYLAWLGVRSLPKLNYASQRLRDRMYRDQDSVMQYWLAEPYGIDGWRLDVYNMTARQGELQLGHKVSREMRRAIKSSFPDCYLIGEHFFDGTPHLQGEELDATMNYQGFNIPLWRWLSGHDSGIESKPELADPNRMATDAFAAQLTHYRAVIPWVIARQQFNQLSSHDTTRILNIVDGNPELVKLGAAMLMTYPGVPCIYYGDELGLPGGPDPDNRRCMPWHDPDSWNRDLFSYFQQLIAFRKSAPALIRGGFQQLYASGDLWIFLRQSHEQALLVVGYRGEEALSSVSVPVWHSGIDLNQKVTDLLTGTTYDITEGQLNLIDLHPVRALILEVAAGRQ